MAGGINFFGWRRSGIYGAISGPLLTEGRLSGSVTLTIQNTEPPNESVSQPVTFDVMGPGDIEALKPGAVVHVVPPPGTPDAEREKCVHADLAAPDLPWRYTPRLAAGATLRPWLALVVGTSDEVQLQPGGQVTLSQAAIAAHDLGRSARWAHVQEDDDHPGTFVGRLVCDRPLKPLTEYVAAVVPAFNADGSPRWTTAMPSVTLPAYHAWTFHTGEDGDFASLAGRLAPAIAEPELGRAPLRYLPLPAAAELSARGALAPIGGTDSAVPNAVANDVLAFTTTLIDPLRPVIGAPRYGAAWVADPDATTWGAAFRRDPRHRGVGGLGLRMGIDEQELLSAAAARQAGALDIAAQRIRHLVAGVAASSALWTGRLPADPSRRLAIFGPALSRIMTKRGTVRDLATDAGRPMPPALFSSAARRVLRPGPARARFSKAGTIDVGAVIEAANACPPDPPRAPDGLPHADLLAKATGTAPFDESGRRAAKSGRVSVEELKRLYEAFDRTSYSAAQLKTLDGLVSQALDAIESGRPAAILWLIAILDPAADRKLSSAELGRRLKGHDDTPDTRDLLALAERIETGPPDRPCLPVDLAALSDDVAAAIDPTADMPFIVTRVLATIDGLDDQPLTPPELCPDLDIPAWQLLRDHAPDWLLPGAADLGEDSVIALETNPAFVDAFLLGLNTQVLAELRFRNIPIASGCTPLRQFWARTNPATETYDDDIVGVHRWPAGSAIGDITHQTPAAASADLVLVFRTPLFRRYPHTVVYLTPAPDNAGVPDWDADPDVRDRVLPSFQGTITPDITFFGFDLDPALGASHWVVLEEPAHGTLFYNATENSPTQARAAAIAAAGDGGAFAAAAYADPIRVMLRGSSLVGGGA